MHGDQSINSDFLLQESDLDQCCICFEQVCTIEVQNCGHQMCAQCTLALCCHKKPNPTTLCLTPPVCPFCRSPIAHLVVAKIKSCDDGDHDTEDNNSSKLRKARRSRNFSEGSSSFKSLSALGSFGKMGGHGSGRIIAGNEWVDKPWRLSDSLLSCKCKREESKELLCTDKSPCVM